MTENTVTRGQLKTLLEMFVDATDLLEQIPKLQDQGKFSEASQHIGAELEARITQMNQLENDNQTIRNLLNDIQDEQINQNSSLKELEKDVLG